MNTLMRDHLKRVATELGMRIVSPFHTKLPSGLELTAEALFPDVGAPNGTVVVESNDSVAAIGRELKQMNYTLSSFAAPREKQEIDIESYKEMFREWSWCSTEIQPPSWFDD